MVKPNYTPGIGGLATNRYDFESHVEGFAFRHNAVQIDVNPAVLIAGVLYITVADALNAMADFISSTEDSGQGFITVGDGYDTYHNANGNPNYDPTIPSLDTILNPLFTYIINYYNNPNAANLAAIPQQYLRIKDGGIVLIKSGTYIIQNTVNVPPGISIVGENFGTKIVNQTSPQAPMFNILPDVSLGGGTRITDIGVDASAAFPPGHLFMFARKTEFFNLTIGDNFIEPISSGDITYRNPINIVQPLIVVNEGANFSCNNIKFLGKTSYSGSNISAVSAMPVGLNSSIPSTSGTSLDISNCIIDGFAQVAQFNVLGSAINSYFTFKNNKVRVYGFLNQNGTTSISSLSSGESLPQSTINVLSTTGFPSATSSNPGFLIINISGSYQLVTYTGSTTTTFTGCSGGAGELTTGDSVINLEDNCFFNINNCNIDASYNYCYGNRGNVNVFLFLSKGAADATTNNHPNITIANNNCSVDRISGSNTFLFFNPSNGSSIYSFLTGPKYSSLVYNNNNSNFTNLSISLNSSDSLPSLLIEGSDVILGSGINTLTFLSTNGPSIVAAETNGSPSTFYMVGQSTSQASTAGGAVVVQGGAGNGAAGGNISLMAGDGSVYGDISIYGNNLSIVGGNTPVSITATGLGGNANASSASLAPLTPSKVTLTARGTTHSTALTAAQVACPIVILAGTQSGSTTTWTVNFPAPSLPTIWFVDTTTLSILSGNTVRFNVGSSSYISLNSSFTPGVYIVYANGNIAYTTTLTTI